jgi:streptogramin lyase
MEPVLCLGGFTFSILIGLLLNHRFSKRLPVKNIIRTAAGILSIFLLACLLVTPAEATTITEYLVPGNPGLWNLSVNSTVVVFTEGAANNVGYLSYLNNTLRQIPVPTPNSFPWGITKVPWTKLTAVFTEAYGNKIGVMAANNTRLIGEYEIPTPASSPRKIIYDKVRNCTWFTEYSGGKLGNFSFVGASYLWTFGELLLPGAGVDSHPIGLALGTNFTAPAAGQPYIWVADFSRKSIVRVHPEKGSCKVYSLSPSFSPWDVAVDPDGVVWFTAQVVGTDVNIIGRLDPVASEKDRWSLVTFSVPTPGCEVHDIEIDSFGNIWFTEFSDTSGKIGRYTPISNMFTEYPIITPTSKPQGLALYTEAGGAVNVWFTEYGGRRIGRIRQPEGPTVSTTVSTITYAVTTSSTVSSETTNWTRLRTTGTSAFSRSTATVTSTSASTASSTIADTVSVVQTSSTYLITSNTYTTATSVTTTTSIYKLTTVSTETTSTTTTSTRFSTTTTTISSTVSVTIMTYLVGTTSSTITTLTTFITKLTYVYSPTITTMTTVTLYSTSTQSSFVKASFLSGETIKMIQLSIGFIGLLFIRSKTRSPSWSRRLTSFISYWKERMH